MSILEGQELDDVQQPSPDPAPAEELPQGNPPSGEAQDALHEEEQPDGQDEAKDGAGKPHPLEPGGERFKQVVAARHKEKERAERLDAELRQEREERIRLEERLKAKEEAKATPQYTWDQLQAAVDEGKISMGKAIEINNAQLVDGFRKEQQAREEKARIVTSVASEMNEYKTLVPNVVVPGTEERQKVEREYGYLVQRLGRPTTKEQELSMELAASRAAFGDVDTLKQKKVLSSKPLAREVYMETSSTQSKAQVTKKEFKSTLSGREVQHYERLMRNGRYPGGWADVQKEHEEYASFKSTGVR